MATKVIIIITKHGIYKIKIKLIKIAYNQSSQLYQTLGCEVPYLTIKTFFSTLLFEHHQYCCYHVINVYLRQE